MQKNITLLGPLSGVMAVIVVWGAMIIGMFRSGLRLFDSRPLSYLATNHSSKYLFTCGLLIGAALLFIFLACMQRAMYLSRRFLLYFALGQVCQIIIALTPYGHPTLLDELHVTVALLLASLVPLMISEFVISQQRHLLKEAYFIVLRIALLLYLIGMYILLFAFNSGIYPMGEAVIVIAFNLLVLVMSAHSIFSKTTRDN